MNDFKVVIEDLNFLEFSKMSFKEFYENLDNAMNLKRIQSIWQLSKIITRFALKSQ